MITRAVFESIDVTKEQKNTALMTGNRPFCKDNWSHEQGKEENIGHERKYL